MKKEKKTPIPSECKNTCGLYTQYVNGKSSCSQGCPNLTKLNKALMGE